jgi:hypothetical protein
MLIFIVSCAPQNGLKQQSSTGLGETYSKNFQDAVAQYKVMMKNLPADKFPKTFFPKTGKYEFSNSDWWCSGFYPGTLLYLYEQTKDPAMYAEALRIMKVLEKEKFNKTTHDLGFMMFCSFGNANRLEPKPEYKEILITSAKSLATRFEEVITLLFLIT